MEASRKPLAKVEGRKRLRLSRVTVEYRGTPSLDDWCAYIVNGTKSRKLMVLFSKNDALSRIFLC